jgi:hypothetical protein
VAGFCFCSVHTSCCKTCSFVVGKIIAGVPHLLFPSSKQVSVKHGTVKMQRNPKATRFEGISLCNLKTIITTEVLHLPRKFIVKISFQR